jgi:hypothetical protein
LRLSGNSKRIAKKRPEPLTPATACHNPGLKLKSKKKEVVPPVKSKTSKIQKVIEVYGDQKDCFDQDEKYGNLGFSTRQIHAGNEPNPVHGGVSVPIDLSTTYAQPAPGQPSSCYDYTRCGNPTVMALQKNLASLE